jgi:hypothetical protein
VEIPKDISKEEEELINKPKEVREQKSKSGGIGGIFCSKK